VNVIEAERTLATGARSRCAEVGFIGSLVFRNCDGRDEISIKEGEGSAGKEDAQRTSR
jgi:hypothetical protein